MNFINLLVENDYSKIEGVMKTSIVTALTWISYKKEYLQNINK